MKRYRMTALVIAIVVTTLDVASSDEETISAAIRAGADHSNAHFQPGTQHPRVVVLTDFPPLDVSIDSGPANKRSDPDDIQSMIRFLLYGNDLHIEGLIATSATFANVAVKKNLLDIIDRYDKVDENLRKHDERYPSAEYLRSVTWEGASGSYGRPVTEILGVGRDSEGSEKIIALLDSEDPRPVWFCIWGGPCDLAQALWKVRETRSEAKTKRLVSKVRVYLTGRQDGSAQWLVETFPELFVIDANHTWTGMFETQDLAWLDQNVRRAHGPLGALYPPTAMGTKPGVKEGDSPSFLSLVSASRGLNDVEHPEQCSWGGQFSRIKSRSEHWADRPNGAETVRRWRTRFNNDFAARMDWCVKDTTAANHAPRVLAATAASDNGGKSSASSTIRLKAAVSDPDGNHVTCRWWHDHDATPGFEALQIVNSTSPDEASVVLPDTTGRQVHIIFEATDDGLPTLVTYRRIVLIVE